ncbi:MAG: 6-bladed beta-propeller [Candidatus Aminicenantes bacterium]|nr:6-bladed beta-propeller [Candidatus Aminicenantes bacterium]MDH5706447.1 6-bladed beta-propeller [Candidatus Aminicenantes bacterium]
MKGEPSTFELEKEDLAELSISRIRSADVDRDGNVYIISNSQIFKFNNEGNFIQTIGQEGKGPGEIHHGGGLRLIDDQNISLYDVG